MAEITPQLIKELREKTGVGMNKCKEALVQTGGDLQAAIDLLRKAGIASAVKKSDREANEGKIGVGELPDTLALVEVNAETDFVVSNERFQKYVDEMALEVAKTKPSSLEAFLKQKYSKDSSLTIDEYRATLVQTIGENIQISRLALFPKTPGTSIAIYSHSGGKIVTMVAISGSSDEEGLARDIAMHVAAACPDYLRPSDVPSDVIEREKEIARDQVKGKPSHIADKIIEGKLKAFFDMVCLVCQKYIRDDALSIEEVVHKKGSKLSVSSFLRWSVGQK